MTATAERAAALGGHLSALRRCTHLDITGFAEVWGRRASLSRHDELGGTGFADLFSLDVVDDLVSRHGLRTPFLRVAKDGRTLPASEFTRGGGVGATIADQVADDRLTRLFADGATLVLQGLHRTHGPLIDLAQQLGADLGHPAQINAYVTPPQSRGFDDHYDVHDVFVLQVSGEKRWVVHEPVLRDPTRDQPWTDRRDEVAAAAARPAVLDIVLRPGDALYLPRGFLHAATALGGISAHLTVGIHPWTRLHLADRMLATLADSAALRRSLPPAASPSTSPSAEQDRAALESEVRQTLDAVIERLHALRDAPDLVDRMAQYLAEQQSAAVRAEPVAPLRQSRALAGLHPAAMVRLRRGLAVQLGGEGTRAVLVTAEATVQLPSGPTPGLLRLLEGDAVAAGDLGAPQEAGLATARELLRQAVAVPV